MKTLIETQLVNLLTPLLTVPLKVKDNVTLEGAFADLEIASTSVIGMGSEVSQNVDDEGNIQMYLPHRSEVVIRYFGDGCVFALAELVNQLKRITVSEQFQKIHIGIGVIENAKKIEDDKAEGEPVVAAELHFFIHYTMAIKDKVGVIDHVKAAHDSGKTTIHLTR